MPDYIKSPYEYKLILLVILAGYILIFYTQLTYQFPLDFSCFYSSALAYIKHSNPYGNFNAYFLPKPQLVAANVNPPFFIEIMQVFTYLPYRTALALWSFLSMIAGLFGAYLVFKLLFPQAFLEKYKWLLPSLYLAIYPVPMNAAIGQMGSFLFLFIIAGYYCFTKRRDYSTGFLWGFITAIKFFPGLLLFFALSQKRYKVILGMGFTFILATLIPLITHGKIVYFNYLAIQPMILWYGDSWNASIHSMLFRLFLSREDYPTLVFIRISYVILFVLTLIWYLKKMLSIREEAYAPLAFCFTLVMMLLLSPFGWLYYFALLLMPYIYSWQHLDKKNISWHKPAYLWLISLSLINFPFLYVHLKDMGSIIFKVTIYSLHFYGLLLLAFLLGSMIKNKPEESFNSMEKPVYLSYLIISIIGFSFFMVLAVFILHLFK